MSDLQDVLKENGFRVTCSPVLNDGGYFLKMVDTDTGNRRQQFISEEEMHMLDRIIYNMLKSMIDYREVIYAEVG